MNPITPSSEESTSASICGTVTDERGAPLVGATVMIVGTSIEAMTDYNGEFIISEVAPGSYSLEASMCGMRQITIDVIVSDGSSVRMAFRLSCGFSDYVPIIIQI